MVQDRVMHIKTQSHTSFYVEASNFINLGVKNKESKK